MLIKPLILNCDRRMDQILWNLINTDPLTVGIRVQGLGQLDFTVGIGVVDERSEIASCYKGIPQNDIGLRTDVYDCCPKTEGIMLMIRAMSPQIVAVDEVGGLCDIEAVKEAGSCGCRVVATIHGENIDDIASKSYMKECIREKLFKRYILIRKGEKRQFEIYDGELCRIA